MTKKIKTRHTLQIFSLIKSDHRILCSDRVSFNLQQHMRMSVCEDLFEDGAQS